MTTTRYKGYTIDTIGISRYIYRPNNRFAKLRARGQRYSGGHETSMAAAKRWINNDIEQQPRKTAISLSDIQSAVEIAGVDPKESWIWQQEHCR